MAAPPTAEAAPKLAPAARPATAAPAARPVTAPLGTHVPAPPSGDAVRRDEAALEQLVAVADATPHAPARARAA